MKTKCFLSASLALTMFGGGFALHGQLPSIMTYQGRVQVGATNFPGQG